MCDWERQQGEKRNDRLNMHREVSEKMPYKLLLTNNWTNYMYFCSVLSTLSILNYGIFFFRRVLEIIDRGWTLFFSSLSKS